ncbi:MAG TPA: hypothetical protein VHT02_06210, partial [Methylocella sp.]|nr:hypothetical protein [Methylocella sp.]
ETEKQLAWVRAAGCTEMQGHLFSRPVPASEIAGLLSPPRIGRQADQYLLTAFRSPDDRGQICFVVERVKISSE